MLMWMLVLNAHCIFGLVLNMDAVSVSLEYELGALLGEGEQFGLEVGVWM